jgi:hypothetical protein
MLESNSILVIQVWVCIIKCLFDALGRITVDVLMAKKTIVEVDILLIQGEPHFVRVNGASITILGVGKGNILMTKHVLHKLKHIICNTNPARTEAMRAFEVTALTDPLNNGHFITMPPITVTVSQQKIGHE